MKEKKIRKKRKPGVVVARVIISIGLVLMAATLTYEAANFPWGIWFGSEQDNLTDNLPDPTPPNDPDIVFRPYDPTQTDAPSDLPDNGGLFEEPQRDENGEIPLTLLGTIKVPRIESARNIIEGTTQTELLYGVGHVRGTPLPGQRGNACLAGHRVTMRNHPFRHIDKMRPGDVVFIHMDGHIYTYTTFTTFIVGNKENWVMNEVAGEEYCLTLISCHPPGSARQRYILRARLTDIDGMTPEAFFTQENVQNTNP